MLCYDGNMDNPFHSSLHLVPNSTTWTLATNTTNGQAHNKLDVVQNVRSQLNLLYNILPAMDTTNEHHQWTSSQQLYNMLYNKFTTDGQKICHIPTCRDVGLRHCDVANLLLRARPLVMSIGGVVQQVCSRCPCSGVWADVVQANLTGYGHVVQHLQLVVSLSIGGVRSRCTCSGVWPLAVRVASNIKYCSISSSGPFSIILASLFLVLFQLLCLPGEMLLLVVQQ